MCPASAERAAFPGASTIHFVMFGQAVAEFERFGKARCLVVLRKLSGNVVFDGPGQDEDFGLEQLTGLLAPDLVWRRGPSAEPLRKLDGALRRITLDDAEFEDLHAFVANGLLDPRARSLCAQIPAAAPSGVKLHAFPECQQ